LIERTPTLALRSCNSSTSTCFLDYPPSVTPSYYSRLPGIEEAPSHTRSQLESKNEINPHFMVKAERKPFPVQGI
jgi:hypothetical protein